MELLEQVLSKTDSKPAQLLRSMRTMMIQQQQYPQQLQQQSMNPSATTTVTTKETRESDATSPSTRSSSFHSLYNNNDDTTTSSSSSSSLLYWRRRYSQPGVIQIAVPATVMEQTPSLTKTTKNNFVPNNTQNNNNNNADDGTDNVSSSSSSSSLLRRLTSFMRQQQLQQQQYEEESIKAVVAKPPPQQQIATSTIVPAETSTTINHPIMDPYQNWMNIQCRICSDTGPEGNARAFVMGPSPLSIVVCQNRLTTATNPSTNHHLTNNNNHHDAMDEMEEILTHELVHVHDVRALALNLLECQNLAYSEIRAAKYAECDILHRPNSTAATTSSNPFYLIRGGGGGGGGQHHYHHQQQRACVKAKAIQATRNLFGERRARECVNAAFESAYADARPFGSGSGGDGIDETTKTTMYSRSTTKASPWETEHSSR
jgi:hypothetical protein